MDTLAQLQQKALERSEQKKAQDRIDAKDVVRHYADKEKWPEEDAELVEQMLGI